MDEPFGALDPITRAELQHEFIALQQRLGKTVVFVTHDLREALLLASRIALMEEGKLAPCFAKRIFAIARPAGQKIRSRIRQRRIKTRPTSADLEVFK